MRRKLIFLILGLMSSFACTLTSTPIPPTFAEANIPTSTSFGAATIPPPTPTATATPSQTQTALVAPTEIWTVTPLSTETASPFPSNTAFPPVESLKARVTAERLSCRYGPGPEYLFLFAFRAGANIELIGRVDAENWNWVLVKNQVPCWISADFIEIQGEILSLPIMYPDVAKLPITPYYPPSEVTSARRNPLTNEITVSWADIPVSLGDYEDDSMQTYIIEVWRCQAGQLIFDPLATRFAYISFIDESGCSEPSHGRVWVQEKHGYAGPAEIPWPE
jgi:hypothetical protein